MDLHVADVTFEKSKSKTRHLFARTNYRVTSLLNNSHISVCSPSTHVMFPTRLQALFGPDMTPTPWSYLWTIFFCLVLLCGTCRSSKGSKLVFVSVTHRHGDRSPWYLFPQDDVPVSFWYEGLGQLSKVGMQQAYLLGKFLRQRYTEELNAGLVFTNYTRTQIYVRSTDVDRTIMTAQCLLAALFQPSDNQEFLSGHDLHWQPIPIHTVPIEKDTLLRGYQTHCPRYRELMEEAEEDATKLEEENKDFFRFLEAKTGLANLTLYTIGRVGDSVLVHKLHNHSFPWANNTNLQRLMYLYNAYLQLRFNTVEKQRLTCGTLVSAILDEMTAKENGSLPQEKIHMYSAHDTTVTMLLSCLGVFDGINPNYTSAVIVELYKEENSNHFYVEVWYKFGPMVERNSSLFCNSTSSLNMTNTSSCLRPLTVPGCSHFQCPLEEFRKALAKIIPSDLTQECHMMSTDYPSLPGQCSPDSFSVKSVLILLVLNVLVLCFLGRWVWKRWKKKQFTEDNVPFLDAKRAEIEEQEEEEEEELYNQSTGSSKY